VRKKRVKPAKSVQTKSACQTLFFAICVLPLRSLYVHICRDQSIFGLFHDFVAEAELGQYGMHYVNMHNNTGLVCVRFNFIFHLGTGRCSKSQHRRLQVAYITPWLPSDGMDLFISPNQIYDASPADSPRQLCRGSQILSPAKIKHKLQNISCHWTHGGLISFHIRAHCVHAPFCTADGIFRNRDKSYIKYFIYIYAAASRKYKNNGIAFKWLFCRIVVLN